LKVNAKFASLLNELINEIRVKKGKRMRTTNMLERQNQELKRRTRVVQVFPHEQSCLRLIAALLMETNQEWMERIYLRMEEEPEASTEAVAAAA
jgi:transposase-like protein